MRLLLSWMFSLKFGKYEVEADVTHMHSVFKHEPNVENRGNHDGVLIFKSIINSSLCQAVFLRI